MVFSAFSVETQKDDVQSGPIARDLICSGVS
jgi:hypothetical protein